MIIQETKFKQAPKERIKLNWWVNQLMMDYIQCVATKTTSSLFVEFNIPRYLVIYMFYEREKWNKWKNILKNRGQVITQKKKKKSTKKLIK